MTKVENAAYAVVHATRDRARDISERTGINLAVLLNKVNQNNDRNHLMLAESVAIQAACGDHRILFAEADVLGYVCVPKPKPESTISSTSMVSAIATACAEFGDYMRQVDSSTLDGHITFNEQKKLERELGELVSAVTALQTILVSNHG